jgi:hypothetical protein
MKKNPTIADLNKALATRRRADRALRITKDAPMNNFFVGVPAPVPTYFAGCGYIVKAMGVQNMRTCRENNQIAALQFAGTLEELQAQFDRHMGEPICFATKADALAAFD